MVSPLCGHIGNCSDPDFFGLPVLNLQLPADVSAQMSWYHWRITTAKHLPWDLASFTPDFWYMVLPDKMTQNSCIIFNPSLSFPLSHTHIHIYKHSWLTNSILYNCSVLILSSSPFPSLPCFRSLLHVSDSGNILKTILFLPVEFSELSCSPWSHIQTQPAPSTFLTSSPIPFAPSTFSHTSGYTAPFSSA